MTVLLNWNPKGDPGRHWGGGQRRPCRICRGFTFLVDEEGAPCHKVCAEQEAGQ
ncbi:hypothetical protein ACWENQ_45555 [Nonomuraea sp. NPDC004354]